MQAVGAGWGEFPWVLEGLLVPAPGGAGFQYRRFD
jgi:hypothetical protein